MKRGRSAFARQGAHQEAEAEGAKKGRLCGKVVSV